MLRHFNQCCLMYAFTRPRYQVSDYRTIGPLVSVKNFIYGHFDLSDNTKGKTSVFCRKTNSSYNY